MLNWFSNAAQHPNEGHQTASDESRMEGEFAVPQTPGPATFAFQALRYGLLGTPKPAKVEIKEEQDEKEDSRNKNEQGNPKGSEEVNRNETKRNDRLAPPRINEHLTTPTKGGAPPQGILLTPGTTLGRKKSVTFGQNNYRHLSPDEAKSQRIRSGLPASYPGKFPSPWTPRVAGLGDVSDTPIVKPAEVVAVVEKTQKPIKSSLASNRQSNSDNHARRATAETKRPASSINRAEMQSFVQEQIAAVKNNTAKLNELMELTATRSEHDPDVTVNLDDPRSGSGKFWKSRYDTDVEAAKMKVECYRDRRNMAVDFASKKDSQCSDLAVRLKEEMELRKRLQVEVEKWQKAAEEAKRNSYIGDRTQQRTYDRIVKVNEELRQMVATRDEELLEMGARLDHQRRELDSYRERIYDLECELDDSGVHEGRATIAAPDQSNTDLLEKIEELERQLDSSRKECKQRAVEEERLKTEVSHLRSEQKKKTSQIAELKWNIESAKKQESEMARKETEIAKLKSEIGVLRLDNESLIAHSQLGPSNHNEAMQALHNKHIETVKDLRATQEQLANLRIEHEQLTQDLGNVPADIPASKSYILPNVSRQDDGVPDLGFTNYGDDIPSLPPMSPIVQDVATNYSARDEERRERIRLPPLESPVRRAALLDVINTSPHSLGATDLEPEKPLNKFASPRPKMIVVDFNSEDEKPKEPEVKTSAIDAKRAALAARVAARKAAMKAALREKED